MSTQATSLNPFWDLVAGVYVINLDQRADRWEKIQRDMLGLVPGDKLTRSPAVLGLELPGYGQRPWFYGRPRDKTWGARAGCTLAHRRVLELSATKSDQPILVLEDDVVFAPESAAVLTKLGEWLRDHPGDWDVCYLGYTDPAGPTRQLANLPAGYSLHEVFGCNCAHAYMVNSCVRADLLTRLPHADTIWSWLSRNRAVDRWYLRTLGRRFRIVALSPSLVRQEAGFSDIVGRKTDYQEAGRHQITIPSRFPGPVIFWLLRRLSVLRSRLGGFYDWLRSRAKRLRGF